MHWVLRKINKFGLKKAKKQKQRPWTLKLMNLPNQKEKAHPSHPDSLYKEKSQDSHNTKLPTQINVQTFQIFNDVIQLMQELGSLCLHLMNPYFSHRNPKRFACVPHLTILLYPVLTHKAVLCTLIIPIIMLKDSSIDLRIEITL